MKIKVLKFDEINLQNYSTIIKQKEFKSKIFKIFNYSETYYVINTPLSFLFEIKNKYYAVSIPEMFATNGRTVPRFLRKYVNVVNTGFDEIYALHDYWYSKQYIENFKNSKDFINKETADNILLQFKKFKSNKLSIISYFEYITVRLFGNLFYNV